MLIKNIVITLFLFLVTQVAGAQTTLQQQIPLKIMHGDALSSNNGRTILKLKEILEAKYPNKFKITIENSSKTSQNGGDLDALNLGLVDMILVDSDSYMGYVKNNDIDVLNLPYLISTDRQYRTTLKTNYLDLLYANSLKTNTNVIPVALWPGEHKILFSKNRLDDMKSLEGKQVLTRNKESSDRFYKIMGGNPILMNPNESESKLDYAFQNSSFIEDSAENILKNKNKYNAKGYINLNANRFLNVILINKNWLLKLNTELRNSVIETIRDIGLTNVDTIDQFEKKEMEALQTTYGLTQYVPNRWEQLDLQQAGKMVQDNYSKTVNKSLLEKIKQEIYR